MSTKIESLREREMEASRCLAVIHREFIREELRILEIYRDICPLDQLGRDDPRADGIIYDIEYIWKSSPEKRREFLAKDWKLEPDEIPDAERSIMRRKR